MYFMLQFKLILRKFVKLYYYLYIIIERTAHLN